MHIDPALLSPFAALFGALMGGCGVAHAAVYTHRRTASSASKKRP